MPLDIPKWAPTILTGPSVGQPSPAAVKLLGTAVKKHLQTDQVYSVTYSKVPCPYGKHYLYTLKPYYWEVSPGKWEHRDGQRNPLCDQMGGQRELEEMAMAVYTLSLGARFLPEVQSQCLRQATKLLQVFFIDDNTYMDPRVEYAQTNPSCSPAKGDQAFVVTIRYLTLVSQSLPYLHVEPHVQAGMQKWFSHNREWMQQSQQGQAARSHGNNITFWYDAMIVSALYATHQEKAVAEADTLLEEMSKTFPTPDRLFARELSRTRPRHYSLFTVEPLFVLASFASHGGTSVPTAQVQSYLRAAVDFALDVRPGAIEKPLEEGGRYEARMAWFQRMLARWSGSFIPEFEPDGSGWERGWNQFCRLEWALI